MPNREAIEYFRRKVPIPTESWKQFDAEQHDWAFTITDLTRADLLEAARELIQRALEEGTSFDDFQKQFDEQIVKRGWQPSPLPAGPKDYRMRTIFETNLRRSYAAGRYQQATQPEMMQLRPYWQWKWRGRTEDEGGYPRPHHKALHNKVFLASDKFWTIAYPPCGYGCRCGVITYTESQFKALGLSVETPPDPYTIAEPGFRRAPGSTPETQRKQVLQEGLSRLSPPLRRQVTQNLRQRGLV